MILPAPIKMRMNPALAGLAMFVVMLSTAAQSCGRTLVVDQRGGAEYRSLAEAAAAVRAGDVIKIAPGSGPYREVLKIPVSGTAEAPIVVDGSGETITGFDSLTGFARVNGAWTLDLTRFWHGVESAQGFKRVDGRWSSSLRPEPLPFVLSYRGERLRQDRVTGNFTAHAKLSADGRTLTLDSSTTPDGWEVSVRSGVVRILNLSHHRYRDLRASGSLNDGFNLHGTGIDLIFERIEAFDNLDEGFSAHDAINCSIVGGKFYRNDNGLFSVKASVTKAKAIACFDNLGWGIGFQGATADLEDIDTHANGVAELVVAQDAIVTCTRVKLRPGAWRQKPWLSAEESGPSIQYEVIVRGRGSILSGEAPLVNGL